MRVNITNQQILLLLLLLLGVVSAILLLGTPGTTDINVYLRWAHAIEQHGFAGGYIAGEIDYPPVGLALFAAIDTAAHLLGVDDHQMFRIAVLLCFMATSAIFYAFTRDLRATTALHWGLLLNSAAMGYSDIFMAPPLIFALWALQRRRILLSVVCFGTAYFIKWQPAILGPFVILYLLNARDWQELRTVAWRPLLMRGLLPGVLLLGLLVLIFGSAFEASLTEAMRTKLLSGNALNFSWILTALLHIVDPQHYGGLSTTHGLVKYIIIEHDSSPLFILPKLLFLASYLVVLYRFFRSAKTFPNLVRHTLVGYLAYFIFNTEVHENHLFVACVLASLLIHLDRGAWPLATACLLAANINLVVFYGFDGRTAPDARVIAGLDLSIPLAILYLVAFLAVLVPVVWTKSSPRNATVPGAGT